MAIDSHCHLDDAAFAADRGQVLQRARWAGVQGIVVPAYKAAYFARLADCCAQPSSLKLWPAYGLHPCYIHEHSEAHLQELEHYLESSPAVALGEIGLDRYLPALREPDRWRRQQELFAAQLQLAERHRLPVIIHARHAYAEVISLLRRHRPVSGIVHAFNGRPEQAYALLDLGLVLGIGGVIAQAQAHRLRDIVRRLPEEAWVLETDAPDMLPYSAYRRGWRRNEPVLLYENARLLAQALNRPLRAVMAQAEQNTRRILRLPAQC